jgi:Bifunctional DNA primase/polymerase, N-terminal/Primase C terminal 1 (PriCT-1)
MHAAALQLAQRGLAVFPCQPHGKEPACDTGLLAATTDVDCINRWWREIPDLNIGIATGAASGIFVLDVDGDEGEASLRQLEQQHDALPSTVEAITGKGRHCYFRMRGSIRNSAGQIGGGLDIRGDGGYVIAPPSIHPSGRLYAWSVDAADDFAGAPEWLHTLLTAVNGNGKSGKPLEHWHRVLTQPICNGERNSTLASIAGKLLHAGLTDGFLLYDLIMCVNIARCEQPLSPSEVETIVISVGRTHLKRLRDA